MESWITIASAGIALLSAAASGYFSFRSLRIHRLATQAQYFGDLRSWADEASAVLSACVHLCDIDPERFGAAGFYAKRHELRVQVSSLVDRGRWFFPNVHHEEVGTYKEEAFRGHRQPVLSSLVRAYGLLRRASCKSRSNNAGLRDDLVAASRRFVSEVQKVLDPRTFSQEFRELIGARGAKVAPRPERRRARRPRPNRMRRRA